MQPISSTSTPEIKSEPGPPPPTIKREAPGVPDLGRKPKRARKSKVKVIIDLTEDDSDEDRNAIVLDSD